MTESIEGIPALGVGYDVGSFGDRRVGRTVSRILHRMVCRRTVCVRSLSNGRAEEVRFGRALHNKRVRMSELLIHAAEPLAQAAGGRHVLALQDTTEVNFQAHSGRVHGLGPVGNGTDTGLFIHPVIAVDASGGGVLGICGAEVWRRRNTKVTARRHRRPADKESYRWLRGAQAAADSLLTAAAVTVVSDAESDSYDLFAHGGAEGVKLLVRQRSDRALAGGGSLFAHLEAQPAADRFTVAVAAGSTHGKRRAPRTAMVEVRHAAVCIRRPATAEGTTPETLRLWAIDVREVNAEIAQPIQWRLLTSHEVHTAAQARQIARWYRVRWTIEEVFRVFKRQGLNIEASQVEDGDALKRLAVLALIAAVRTLQLVRARDGQSPLAAEHVFSVGEMDALRALGPTLEGRTQKQSNPHPAATLPWAAWIIARLGGWKGYQTEAPPGPITFSRGLHEFFSFYRGFAFAKFCA